MTTTQHNIWPGETLCDACRQPLIHAPGNAPGPNEGERIIALGANVWHERCAPEKARPVEPKLKR
jgi:hypothetical protein